MVIRCFSLSLVLCILTLNSCRIKGPITYDNPFVGKTKEELVKSKGTPQKIKNFGSEVAYIYVRKEEFYGNTKNLTNKNPKATYNIEYIYYINSANKIYKYQVWKRKVKN